MHPLAWWGWALGLAVATTRTTNPVVIALVLAAVVVVVLRHRDDTPWGRALPGYLVLGAVIVAVRVGLHVLVGAPTPGTVVLDLPVIPAPDWATEKTLPWTTILSPKRAPATSPSPLQASESSPGR